METAANQRQTPQPQYHFQRTYSNFGADEQRDDQAVDGNCFTEDDADKILGSNARRSHAGAHDACASVVDTAIITQPEVLHGEHSVTLGTFASTLLRLYVYCKIPYVFHPSVTDAAKSWHFRQVLTLRQEPNEFILVVN